MGGMLHSQNLGLPRILYELGALLKEILAFSDKKIQNSKGNAINMAN
jgi:hypothetical protein